MLLCEGQFLIKSLNKKKHELTLSYSKNLKCVYILAWHRLMCFVGVCITFMQTPREICSFLG